MPRLLLFAPCQVFTRDAETERLSLVNLMEHLEIFPLFDPSSAEEPEEEDPNEPGSAPGSWYVVTLWRRVEGDEDKKFELRVRLVSPEGRNLVMGMTRFSMTTSNHRVTWDLEAFPLTGEGIYHLLGDLRELPDGEWKELGYFPIDVERAQAAKKTEPSQEQQADRN